MTISHVDWIMDRVRVARPDSPIAVFKCMYQPQDDTWCTLNAVFADTIPTRLRIATKPSDLIGVFDNTMSMGQVKLKLEAWESR